jgi:glycosyltransferase involved in cell wall biosynthesis
MDSNVTFFLPSLEGGGAERCMVTLARGLARRKVKVTFVLSKAEGPYLPEALDIGKVVDFGTRKVSLSIPPLIRYLRTEHPDTVVAALEHANTAALIAKRMARAGTRVLVTAHTMVSLWMRSHRPLRSLALLHLMRLVYPKADAVVAVSGAVASDLSRILGVPERSIRVIYNPVPIDEVMSLSRAPVDSAWFQAGGSPVVLTVGSLWPHKDHKTLIEAIGIASRARPLRLVILGEGPERLRLEAQIKRLGLEGEVLLRGFVDNPFSWMARSSVFVLPSKWEGLPMALIEAMACGVTPVVTNCPGGSPEVLENGRYGYLTPVGDPIAMAERILQAIDGPFNPIQLRKRADDFSVERSVTGYLDLLNPSAT